MVETIERARPPIDTTSEEFVEELLTSPYLLPYADAARNQLLNKLYSDGLNDHSMYDIISLTGSHFRGIIEEELESGKSLSALCDNQELAKEIYNACSAVAHYLGLDLLETIKRQVNNTMYGRSRIDGIVNILVVTGSGIYDL